jgi:hypothetical protein
MLAVALTAAVLAAPVPVSGGTAAERAIVRQVLRGADAGTTRFVRIDGRRLVLGPPARRQQDAIYVRAGWEEEALVASVYARLAARGDELEGFAITGSTQGTFAAEGAPALSPPGARRLRSVVLANARTAGLDVRSARVLPVGGGVLEVTVRLREDQLFDSAAQRALLTLFGPVTSRPVAAHFLIVQEPDGTAVADGGTFGNGGLWASGGDTGRSAVPRTVPARLWRARTDLVVRMTRYIGLVRKRSYRIVCGGTRPAAGSTCARILADRWALLVPAPGWQCAGAPIGAWNVSVSGTFAGQPVSRSYDGCYGGTVERWAHFLRP